MDKYFGMSNTGDVQDFYYEHCNFTLENITQNLKKLKEIKTITSQIIKKFEYETEKSIGLHKIILYDKYHKKLVFIYSFRTFIMLKLQNNNQGSGSDKAVLHLSPSHSVVFYIVWQSPVYFQRCLHHTFYISASIMHTLFCYFLILILWLWNVPKELASTSF